MPRKKLEQLIGVAKNRLQGRKIGKVNESPEVTLSATLDILTFAEREAQRLKVPLPADHHNLRAVLTDPEKACAIIEKEGKETGA